MKKDFNPRKEDLVFLPLGGCDEIGMNLNLYHYNGKWLMVDLGITFGHDLGIDIMMADPQYIVDRKKDLMGLVLTHAHEDHIGAIPHLWDRLRCPIYATPFTAILIREKLKEVGLAKHAKIHVIKLGGHVDLDPFTVEFITLTHSIPEPNALAIRTSAGTIVHTGDWKIDDAPMLGAQTDQQRLQQLGDEGVLALVCDSTNVFVNGRTGSEAHVRQELARVVAAQKQRVVVACFASNVARVESAALAAQHAGRRVALVGRSLYRMEEAARQCGYLKGIPPFLHEEEIKNIPAHELLLICTGSQAEPRSALTRIAQNQHPHAKLYEGDTVIFSSRMIPGNEEEIRHVQDQLMDRGLIVIKDHDEDIHVSGHPARDDLKMMYEWIRPKIIIPVHGERAHLREHVKFAQNCGVPQGIQPHNGAFISLNAAQPRIIDTITVGRLAMDGHVLVPRTNTQLRDRHRMMESGVVFVTLWLSQKGTILKAPMISLVGVVEEGAEDANISKLKDHLLDIYRQTHLGTIKDRHDLQELTRINVRRYFSSVRGKKPLVNVHIMQGS